MLRAANHSTAYGPRCQDGIDYAGHGVAAVAGALDTIVTSSGAIPKLWSYILERRKTTRRVLDNSGLPLSIRALDDGTCPGICNDADKEDEEHYEAPKSKREKPEKDLLYHDPSNDRHLLHG